MVSRFSSFAFVLTTAFLVIVSQLNLPFAIAQAQTMQDHKAEADRLLSQGIKQYQTRQVDAAIQSWQKALIIYREIQNRLGEGQSLANLGSAYQTRREYGKAIDYQMQSLVISRELKDRLGEGQSLGDLGIAYQSLDEYHKAIDYHLQSLAIAKEIQDRPSEGKALGGLGIAYYSIGKYDQSIDYNLQRLAVAKEIKDRYGEGVALGNLGIVYKTLGKYDTAINYQLQRLAISREINDPYGMGQSLGSLGNTYYSLGEYDKAIEYYLKSLAIKMQIKDRYGEGNTLGNLGIAYDSLGKYDQAIEYHLQRLEIAKEINDRSGEMYGYHNLGSAYSAINRDQEAMISYQRALTIAREIGDQNIESFALGNIGKVLSKSKQPELTILFYKQSINVREAIRIEIRNLDKELQKSYLATISDNYKRLADLLLKQDRVMESLQVIDLLKVQELEDYLKNIKGSDRRALGVKILEPEKVFISKLFAISPEQSPDFNSKLASQIQQIPKSELNKVPEYLQNIPQGTVLLYPLILDDRLEIVLFSPDAPPIHRNVDIKKEEFEDLVLAFRLYLRDTKTLKVKDASKQLYDVLIKPIEEDLKLAKATTILYSPDDVLRYVPLAALYDGKQWLVEKYRISNLIAYNLTDFTPKAKSSPNILAGAYGNGNPKTGQIPLPATIKEVSAISNTFPNTVNLIESAFSFSATEAQTPKHNILHLATHAEFNGNPNTSFIYFGNGDTVSLSNIKDWKMSNIDLIVLSACQTGSGKLGNGIEILGFGYQVQLAGAKASIASLWKVSDEGTQALMKSFYENIKQGDRPISESLRQAQIDTIRSQQFSHPFYWSAFILIGSGL